MATTREIAAALQDDAETRAILHGLDTYQADAAMFARDIATAMSITPSNMDERQALDRLLASLNDKFYTQVDLCVEILLGF